MCFRFRPTALFCFLIAFCATTALAQDDPGWRISPFKINIQLGTERDLQLLDDNAQEIHGAQWGLDRPDLAEIREENGLAIVHPKAIGTVRVSATLGEQTRFRDITIWSPVRPLPQGTTNWGMQPIGREIRDLPAVPTYDGPKLYSLEQTPLGETYLRAVRDDGIQVWTWLVPEHIQDVELVCGDWLGGALLSANHSQSYTLYAVGKDGKLRWQHTLSGLRKGHAYNLQHLVHLISQSRDGTVTSITGLDEVTGAVRFQLTIPASSERHVNLRRSGVKVACAEVGDSVPLRTFTSQLFVNIDEFAYVAFTQNTWTLRASKCIPGAPILLRDVSLGRSEKILLWQIHPDGTYRSTVVEELNTTQPLSNPISVASPTGAIIPDGLQGELLPVRLSHDSIAEGIGGAPDELIYRITQDGDVAYKFPLPKYDGPLHDDMVLGEDDIGFATRGGTLIAFNVRNGAEVWRWESNTTEINVFAALANGGCIVKTPTAIVQVERGGKTKELMKGNAILDWQGHIFQTHN